MVLIILTGSITYIASLSLFATLLYYVIGIASAWSLRRKKPDLHRPYRAPLIWLGAPVSILIYLAMMTQLDWKAIVVGVAWNLVGLSIYAVYGRKHLAVCSASEQIGPVQTPPAAERHKMDREYHIWRTIVIGAVILVCCLFLLSFVIGH